MNHVIFPLAIGSEELRLLTGLIIGLAFGFCLERGGFGNARKLAAQFYLNDMTVFKVMFTGILTAMVGFYTLAGLGLVDVSAVWINPTFLWSQLIGGFLLGVGFIMSGLCPGTSVVSAVSGRIDAVVTLVGIFAGTWLFALAVGAFPWMQALYHGGSLGVSTLPDLMHVPAPLVVLMVVAMAGAAFIGAEAVERRFQPGRPPVELTPVARPLLKFAVAGSLALVVVAGVAAKSAMPRGAAAGPTLAESIDPSTLAERLIARDPQLVILDLRGGALDPKSSIPTSTPAVLNAAEPPAPLADALPGALVVLVTANGQVPALPAGWPAGNEYRLLRGGWNAWQAEVLTPAVPAPNATPSVAESARLARQNQMAAWFSGAAVAAPAPSAAPPAAGAAPAGAKPKKKGGGC